MKRTWIWVLVFLAAHGMLWGMTADELTQKTGIAGGLCAFPRATAEDVKLALELAQRPAFIVHVMVSDEKEAARIRSLADAAGVMGRTFYVETGSAASLPLADRLADLLVISNLSDADLTPELRAEWLRVVSPRRGCALVGRPKTAGAGLSKEKLTTWTANLPLTKTQDDAAGIWVSLRQDLPPGSDPWTHRLHGPESSQVSTDTAWQAPFLAQWWGMPRFEGFWGTTVVGCNGRMFTIRGSRVPSEPVSLTARSINNGIVLWQRGLRQTEADKKIAHGGYVPGRSCVVATEDSLFLVDSNGVLRLDAETGKERDRIAGFQPDGQVKWIAISNKRLAMLSGEPDAITSLSFQTVASNTFGRVLAVFDSETGKPLWHDTAAGDIDERMIVARGPRLYYLAQNDGVV
jgi:hypothetical protein